MRVSLKSHPETPPNSIRAVDVEVVMTDPDDILLRYFVDGSGLSLPEWESSGRADELWTTTCFELFLAETSGETYYEFNFSPSSQWAAYVFDRYREGRQDLTVTVEPFVERFPEIEPEDGAPLYVLDADLDLSDIPPVRMRMGLSAVIEEQDGTKSYWALAHPAGKPDFHHPDCFTLELPPPARS
ncbi:MAG TPA: DOMON-like domain-containing protein [Allosphingosinicella sp.]|jgi:hypothetical protein|nr:DOMON-like domain-containing protein [Allosphingosinicella sp.]